MNMLKLLFLIQQLFLILLLLGVPVQHCQAEQGLTEVYPDLPIDAYLRDTAIRISEGTVFPSFSQSALVSGSTYRTFFQFTFRTIAQNYQIVLGNINILCSALNEKLNMCSNDLLTQYTTVAIYNDQIPVYHDTCCNYLTTQYFTFYPSNIPTKDISGPKINWKEP